MGFSMTSQLATMIQSNMVAINSKHRRTSSTLLHSLSQNQASTSARLCLQRTGRYKSLAQSVRPLQSTIWRVAAIRRVDDEFPEGTEVAGDLGGETSAIEGEDIGKEVQIDLQLPRRRLLVEFTCNVCQTRTQRVINPEAYKRGTVYVQCAGCDAYHQLVDNLGLVVEYDFREDSESQS